MKSIDFPNPTYFVRLPRKYHTNDFINSHHFHIKSTHKKTYFLLQITPQTWQKQTQLLKSPPPCSLLQNPTFRIGSFGNAGLIAGVSQTVSLVQIRKRVGCNDGGGEALMVEIDTEVGFAWGSMATCRGKLGSHG